MSGKHIELFLVEGTPGGLTTAEIMNWTGHVMSARRSDMGALLNREEVTGTCIYFLLGEDEDGVARCYVGETEDFRTRLKSHDSKKSFWDRVVVVTSKDSNLTKAHGRYLESQLISLSKQAGRAVLDNETEPPRQALPEAHISDMDYFIGQLQIILPVLGVDVIRVKETQSVSKALASNVSESPVFMLKLDKHGVLAKAKEIDGEFTVLAGSKVIAKWLGEGQSETTKRAYASFRVEHEKLIQDGSILVSGHIGTLMRDIVFSSPSRAGAIALGRSCNGRREWVSEHGQMFGDWESRAT